MGGGYEIYKRKDEMSAGTPSRWVWSSFILRYKWEWEDGRPYIGDTVSINVTPAFHESGVGLGE